MRPNSQSGYMTIYDAQMNVMNVKHAIFLFRLSGLNCHFAANYSYIRVVHMPTPRQENSLENFSVQFYMLLQLLKNLFETSKNV